MRARLDVIIISLSIACLLGGCGEDSDRLLLMRSIQNEDTNQIASLAGRGVDLSRPDRTGPRNTPLMWAMFEHQNGAAEVLLRLGADPDVKNRDGETVLMRLCNGGDDNLKAVELVLKYRANVNAKDRFGETALDCAITSSSQASQLVELLKQHGAVRGRAMINSSGPK